MKSFRECKNKSKKVDVKLDYEKIMLSIMTKYRVPVD